MRTRDDSGRLSRPLFAFLAVLTGLTAALLLQSFVLQVYRVPSGSMRPTLLPGDRVLVDKFTGAWRPLRRGDVIVFDATDVWTPATNGELVVKRIIGLPGDRVSCCDRDGHLERNGVHLRERYAVPAADPRRFRVVVPPGRLWVMGDDRGLSLDSSAYRNLPDGGSVPVNDVVGRAVAVVWPIGRAGILGTP